MNEDSMDDDALWLDAGLDGEQPRPRVGAAEAAEVAQRPQHRVLDDILRIVAVAHQPAREVVRCAEVRQHLRVEASPALVDLVHARPALLSESLK